MFTDIINQFEHIAEAVKNADVETVPFKHLYVHEVIKYDSYRTITTFEEHDDLSMIDEYGRKEYTLDITDGKLWEEESNSFKTAKTRDDLYVLISSRSKRISELLTYFEVPNHRQFKANIPDFVNPKMPYIKTNAQDNLRLFQQSSNKALSFLFDGETQDDPSFLYTLFVHAVYLCFKVLDKSLDCICLIVLFI